jgi:hypothetical protein
MKRSFLVALLLSALAHLMLLAAPGWYVGGLIADDAPTIEAKLIVPVAKPAPSVKPVKPKPVPRKAPKKVPLPEAPAVATMPDSAPKPELPAEPPETLAHTDAPPEPEHVIEPAAPDSATAAEPEVVTEVATEPIPEIALVLPRSGRIRYSIIRGDGGFVIGKSIQEWQHDGKRYSIRGTSETTGIAAIFKPIKAWQSSEGSILNGEMKPDNFQFDRGNNDIVSATFDWKAQQVTLGNGQVVPITDGAEDVLSMFYQLTQAAQRGEGFVMAVATGKKVERYAFEWLGEEALTTKAGRFRTWHVRVRAASGGKDTTEIWLGREVAALPIRIRNTDRNGGIFDQVAEEITYEGQ